MARNKSSRLKATSHIILVLSIPFLLAACTVPRQPLYQPTSEISIWSPPFQGYESHQIDERTYLITYVNYFSVAPEHAGASPLSKKWLKGAQEYVLYRAGELTKSKGERYFVVLYKDDWNHTYGRSPMHALFMPSASVVIRILSNHTSSIPRDEDSVYEVDKLMEHLARNNIGLAEYQKTALPHDGVGEIADKYFIRWRSSILPYDPPPYHPRPRTSDRQKAICCWYPTFWSTLPVRITEVSTDTFEIATWDEEHYQDFPLQLLALCLKLARREDYRAFKLENWIVEEHRAGGDGDRDYYVVWFRAMARVVFLRQKDPESLEPMFVVEEIRPYINKESIQGMH